MTKEMDWLLEEKYGGEKTEGFFADCKRLEDGEPLAYLIGHVPFLNTTIYLDSRPLIPRPETEFWTEKAISEMKNLSTTSPLSVLDLCAGSGAIGIAIAKSLPNTQVDFIEIDTSHHQTITHSVKENNIEEQRVRIFGGDLFTELSSLPSLPQYDFIFTNPPYIDPELDRTERSVTAHEPHLALYGGHKGFEIIKKIVADTHNVLKPTGELWIEHEPEHSTLLQTLATQYGYLHTTHTDQYEHPRFSVFTMAQ